MAKHGSGRVLAALPLVFWLSTTVTMLLLVRFGVDPTLSRLFQAGNVLMASTAIIVTRTLLSSAARPAHERQLWATLLGGVLVLSGGVFVAQTLALVAGPSRSWAFTAGALVYGAATLLAAPFFYQGMVHWNRSKSQHADPSDWFNGLSAVLVVGSAGNAFLPTMSHDDRLLDFLQHQAALLTLGVAIVLVGSAVTVAFIGDLARDRRLWWVGLAMVLLFAPITAGVFSPRENALPTQGIAMLAVSLIMLAAGSPIRPGIVVAANPRATSNGAIVVVIFGVAMLIVCGFSADIQVIPTVYAACAVVGVSAQLLKLVRDLEQLTDSRRQALTDELTGVANRRALLAALARRLAQNEPATLLIIDLDEFKQVNDRYGHGVGDELLRGVCENFARELPRGATLARLGGDEFAVLMSTDNGSAVLDVAHRLVDSAAPQLDVDGKPVRVRASVGVAGAPAGGLSPTELMRRADTAMYRAKATGSGVFVYDEELDARRQEQLTLLEDLRDVLDDGSRAADQLTVYFQPQLDVATGAVVGAEALVRWQHPALGLLTPDRFLDLVEANGLMNALTARVLDQAVHQWHRFRTAGHDLRVSVNLSTSCLARPGLLTLLDDVLARGVDPDSFVLEITETAVMTDPELAIGTMRLIAARGFRISIDDYGTGYSSLSYLNDLPAVELKIDRSFIMKLLADDRTTAIFAGTVDLAHRLGMNLVAEGVEDAATLAILRDLGCDQSQGYLHARPMPAEALVDWLIRHQRVASVSS